MSRRQKRMFVDGTLVGSFNAAAQLLGVERTTLWRLVKRGVREYKGHTFHYYDANGAPDIKRCPHCGRLVW